jgi:SAM-dependent MidA family methyltransferase
LTRPLPLPSIPPQSADHVARVTAHVVDLVERAGGAISFERYMEAVLYAPGLGYYSAGASKLGAGGDFVTAPEISPLFGRCLARNVAPCLEALGGGEVLEFGAGTGMLAATMLEELDRLGAPLAGYRILERGADLRQRQCEMLSGVGVGVGVGAGRVAWLETLPEPGFRGVIVANEVLDAFAAARFRLEPEGVSEWLVRVGDDGLEAAFGEPVTPWLAPAVERLLDALPERLAPGYVSEIAPARDAWVRSVAEILEAGLVVVIDYGYARAEYYHPQRTQGTLRCYLAHRAHDDPFLAPGLQDVSVHVDFTAVALAAQDAGLDVAGFTTQADFLLASGLLEDLARTPPGAPQYLQLADAVKVLTLPSEMGEAVKVLVLARAGGAPLPGLAGRDHRARLLRTR